MWRTVEHLVQSTRHCSACNGWIAMVSSLSERLNNGHRVSMSTATGVGKVPVITVPIPLQDKLRKIRRKLTAGEVERRTRLSRLGNPDKPIVTCRRPMFDYYKGQTFSKFEAMPLTSRGWQNRKSDGDHFTINRFDHEHPAFVHQDNIKLTFEDFNVSRELQERLKQMNITTPTNIQALALPSILSGHNTMCAAETGSGKTLAYLLPIVQHILMQKEVMKREAVYNAPLALILVPSRELANQIYKVAVQLCQSLSISSTVLVGGAGTKKIMLNPPIHDVDIVVSSLGVIKKLVSSGVYSVSRLRHLVIDESDTMLDDSFSDLMLAFLRKIRFRDCIPSSATDPDIGTQLTLIGATLPTDLEVILRDVVQVGTIEKITTSHLHRLMGHVPQTFLRLKPSNKPAKLLQLVKSDVKNKKPVMIFSKNAATADYVHIFLQDNGIEAVYLHAKMGVFWRSGKFDQFQQGLCDVISCTDIASRGLDTARVQHIINYDFPVFISDYIHRVGRSGRVSSVGAGRVTNFVSTPEEIALVQKIEVNTTNSN